MQYKNIFAISKLKIFLNKFSKSLFQNSVK